MTFYPQRFTYPVLFSIHKYEKPDFRLCRYQEKIFYPKINWWDHTRRYSAGISI